MIKRYDSIAALRDEALRIDALSDNNWHGYGNKRTRDFFGGETVATTLQRCEIGDRALVPEAETLIASIESEISTPRRTWERAVAGAYACVPEAIAGYPTPMRRMIEIQDERAPITLLAISTISAALPDYLIRKRGTVILALTMALMQIRPVSLWTVATMDGSAGDRDDTILATRINTTPIDIATAAWALTSPSFARRINYGIGARLNGFRGGWPERWKDERLRNEIAPDPSRALVIRGGDVNDPMIVEPVLWINSQIARFTQTSEQELIS